MKELVIILIITAFGYIYSFAQTVNIYIDDRVGGYPEIGQVNSSYTNVGFTTVNITSGLIDATVTVSNYDVLIINEFLDTDFLTSTQRTIAQTFVENGGHVIWIAEQVSGQTNPNMITTVNNIYGTSLIYGTYFNNGGAGSPNQLRVHPSTGPAGLSPQSTVIASGTYATLLNVFGGNAVYTSDIFDGFGNSFDACTHTTFALFPSQPIPTEGSIMASTEVQIPFKGEFMPWIPAVVYDVARDNAIAQLHFNLITGVDMTTINSWASTPANYNSACNLSIKLLSFDVIPENSSVSLKWKTASETNNEYFTIERSQNGKNWKEIEKIEGANNSSSLLYYQTTDDNPYSGISYYRLKQTDFNGRNSYSQIRSVNLKNKNSLNIYPNPTKNNITIKGYTNELDLVKIYNVLGKDVTMLSKIDRTSEELKIDLSNLNDGIYYIKTKTITNKIYKH